MKGRVLHRLILAILLIGLSAGIAMAETVTRKGVTIKYETRADGSVIVTDVWNNTDQRIDLKIDKNRPLKINARSSAKIGKIATRYIRFDFPVLNGDLLWRTTSETSSTVEKPASEAPALSSDNSTETREEERKEKHQDDGRADMPKAAESRVITQNTASASPVGYFDRLNQDPFFSTEAVTSYTREVDSLCKGIDVASDKRQFIIDNDVEQLLASSRQEISEKRNNLTSIAREIVKSSNVDASSQTAAMNLIVETLGNRLKTREEAYNRLNTKVADVTNRDSESDSGNGKVMIFMIIGVILIAAILIMVFIRRKRKVSASSARSTAAKPSTTSGEAPTSASSPDGSSIVVRRRTTSILKKQCLDDVIDNPAYLLINSSDFTPDSAVRNIYIKNSCIKDVYNLYAEDLRNSGNPKEDGCMVLGRWVYDESINTYDISLEDVVFPGDDAIFKEYELNFGGKIKLRIAERLRKLRRDSNLQYDLVCWIHSHPGLGVFFSNSDDNVQMQLKHAQHPNFLIAFVVDILTSDQELGIFTFRKDGSMNSKGDLTKMYSLEEMYKWALESARSSFTPENYYNILSKARLKLPMCKGVELNNSSIIDMTQILTDPTATGIVGWAVGTTVDTKGGQEYAVSSIVRDRPGTGVIGCLVSMTHMSLPTIQRLIARDSADLSFVMVYSSRQLSLTTIPVINGELLSDEQFYGDENIDDLKIWTRRKR